MTAYNPIPLDAIERIATLGGWDITSRPSSVDLTIVLTRREQLAGDVEIKVSCSGRLSESEICWWSSTELDGYDSRDDEFDHQAPEPWQSTVALGSLISRLLRPVR